MSKVPEEGEGRKSNFSLAILKKATRSFHHWKRERGGIGSCYYKSILTLPSYIKRQNKNNKNRILFLIYEMLFLIVRFFSGAETMLVIL
jgi:hypothetical protein